MKGTCLITLEFHYCHDKMIIKVIKIKLILINIKAYSSHTDVFPKLIINTIRGLKMGTIRICDFILGKLGLFEKQTMFAYISLFHIFILIDCFQIVQKARKMFFLQMVIIMWQKVQAMIWIRAYSYSISRVFLYDVTFYGTTLGGIMTQRQMNWILMT